MGNHYTSVFYRGFCSSNEAPYICGPHTSGVCSISTCSTVKGEEKAKPILQFSALLSVWDSSVANLQRCQDIDLEYIASNDRIIGEWWVWNNLWPNRGTIAEFVWRNWGKPWKVIQDSWCLDRDSNKAFLEYKSKLQLEQSAVDYIRVAAFYSTFSVCIFIPRLLEHYRN